MTPDLIDWTPGVQIQGDDYPDGFEVQVISDFDTILQRYGEEVIDFYTLPGEPSEMQSAALKLIEGTTTNENDATATFTICTNQKNRHKNKHQLGVNRFGQGMRFEEWVPAPNVLWAHGKDKVTMPVGVAEDRAGKILLQASTAKVNSTCRFNQSFGFAMDVFRMVNEKFIRMASVGFDPVKAILLPSERQHQSAERVMTLRDDKPGFEFVETILREWSILPVGADPGAMRQCFSDGKVGGEKITDLTKRVIEQYAEPKPAIGRGFDASMLSGLQQSIEKLTERFDKFVEKASIPTPTVELVETPAVEQTIEETPVTTTDDHGQPSLQEQLSAAMKQEAEKQFAPLAEDVKKLAKQLQYASGRLP